MVLKQRFTNGSEQNTQLGPSYTLIEHRFNPSGWANLYEQHFGKPKDEVDEKTDAVAFIVYNEGVKPETIPLYQNNYNAVMSDNGSIYHVVTCMPL